MAEILFRDLSVDLFALVLVLCAGEFCDKFLKPLQNVDLGIVLVASLLQSLGEVLLLIVPAIFDYLVRKYLVDLGEGGVTLRLA